jgi:hypothetical protein
MPWVMVFELAITLRKHWRRLDLDDRKRLGELIRKSQGLPTKLEPAALARSVMPIGRKAAKSRKRP